MHPYHSVLPVSSFCKASARTLWASSVMCIPSTSEHPAPGRVFASRNRTWAMPSSIGFSRAARLVDVMEMEGLVSPAAGGKPREVLVDKGYFDEVDAQLR